MSRGSCRKPRGDEIRVCLDSGANIHSANHHIVDPPDLGFETKAEWDAATEEEKYEAVRLYFAGNGWPEYSWDDSETAR